MKLVPYSDRENHNRAGQLKLRSLFAFLTVIGVFLAWHRQFWYYREYDKCPSSVTLLAMGLPLAILLSGVWPKLREALIAVAPVLIIVLCLNCTWTTIYTLMQLAHSVPPMTEYSYRSGEILWGSFLWGFGLPAATTCIASSFEISRREIGEYRFSVVICVIAMLNTMASTLFLTLLCNTTIQDLNAFGNC